MAVKRFIPQQADNGGFKGVHIWKDNRLWLSFANFSGHTVA
jgi:hypothetical protein